MNRYLTITYSTDDRATVRMILNAVRPVAPSAMPVSPCTCGERPGMMRCQDCGPDAIDRNNAEELKAAKERAGKCQHCKGTGRSGGREHGEGGI